jgi:dTDP-4-dehydrorhamnose 3,5-epimerase
VSNGGPATSWADLARVVFAHRGRDESDVTPVSTEEYTRDRPQAPRPRHSLLDLAKLEATGFEPTPATTALTAYLTSLPR